MALRRVSGSIADSCEELAYEMESQVMENLKFTRAGLSKMVADIAAVIAGGLSDAEKERVTEILENDIDEDTEHFRCMADRALREWSR
jgi:hypothetical protein